MCSPAFFVKADILYVIGRINNEFSRFIIFINKISV